MKVNFKIQDKNFILEAYRTSQEKDLLFLSSFEITDLDQVLNILNFQSNEKLSDNEKKVIIYKYREISVGDEIDMRFKCKHCGTINDVAISIENLIIEPLRNDDDVKKSSEPITNENLGEFVDIDVDELDITEFEDLKIRIQQNQINFNFIKTVKCGKCQKEKQYDISSEKYIIESMSEDSLMSLYKTYNNLNFFGNYTKLDIDSMMPFEREIFMGLINKTKEDLSNG